MGYQGRASKEPQEAPQEVGYDFGDQATMTAAPLL
jgi:hypothetical protein